MAVGGQRASPQPRSFSTLGGAVSICADMTRHSCGHFDGHVDEGYGKVADAFRRNVVSGREIGAAVAVYRDGRAVVDLWGGLRNDTTGAPWQKDTLVTVFSTTKGVASLAVAIAVSRGLLDYDAKVADYWPEFAQAGKAAITVRQLLAHQAGLVVIKPPLTFSDLTDPAAMSAMLAAQAPLWPPGTRHGYHALILGWYVSELVRRADARGRTIGPFFDEEIARPLDLDFYIGLPPHIDRDRVAYLRTPTKVMAMRQAVRMPPRQLVALANPFGLSARTVALVDGVKDVDVNSDELRAVEIPAGNGTGTTRALAKLYGLAAIGGAELGVTPAVLNALKAAAVSPKKGVRRLRRTGGHVVLAWLQQADVGVGVRIVRQCVRNTRRGRIFRLRRSRHRCRVRLRDEPDGPASVQRSARTCAAPGAVPRRTACAAAALML
jgi:CubicO group peptidase (beta-lactamase class C family)